jgi:hypothetical protein
MSGKKLPTERNVKKHVGAIHITNKLSLLERKISNVLLWNAYEDLLKEETHKIRIKDLADMVGFNSNDRALLKQSMVNLMRTVLEWNVLDDKGREKDWEASTMLEYTRVKGMYCYYSYGKKLREKLYNPTMYERINLEIQKKFSSGYALALYENCLRYKNTGTTGWIALDRFRRIMGVNPKEYSDFRRLNERVIKGPLKQVNNSSDIVLEPEYKREKRRIVAVRFQVSENPQLSLFKAPKSGTGDIDLVDLKQLEAGGTEIKEKLLKFGLTEEQVEWATSSFDEEYIRKNMEVVERDYKAGKVGNLPAYTVGALQKDYRPKKNEFEEEQKKKKQARRKDAEKKLEEARRLEDMRMEFDAERIQDTLNRMPTSEYSAFEKRFQHENRENMIYKNWKDKGPEHPVMQGLFRAFAKKELLQEVTEEEFYEYAQKKGVTPERGVITIK